MSCVTDCTCPCPTPTTVNVPGVQGENAFTNLNGCFTVPAKGNQITITVLNTDWMAVGSDVFIPGAGTFEVITVVNSTTVTLEYLNIDANTHAAETLTDCDALVSPGCVASDGTDGINAFTVVGVGGFTVPAVGNGVSIPVGSSVWMVVGQNIFVQGAGYFEVTAKADATHVTATYLNYEVNTHATDIIAAGAGVSPGGTQPTFLNDITSDTDDALAYDITNTYASVGVAVTCAASARYLILANISVLFTGVTFASSRVLSIRVRNTTQNTTLAETTRETNIHTTLSFPAIDYVVPTASSLIALNDVLELQCFLDTVESAGTSVVTEGSLAILPISLT